MNRNNQGKPHSPADAEKKDSPLSFLSKSIVIPVMLTLFGAIIGYAASRITENRKDELDRVNAQITKLYGPLHAYSTATSHAWGTFSSKFAAGRSYFFEGPLSETDIRNWRTWMKAVFYPLDTKIETTIIENVQLIDGVTLYPVFQEYLIYITALRATMARWDEQPKELDKSTEANNSVIAYPHELDGCIDARLRFALRRQKTIQSAWISVPDVSPDTPFPDSCK